MYFKNCRTVSEIKKEYRRLARQHHPDFNQSDPSATAKMQAINEAYHKALAAADGEETQGTDNKTHTYHYNEATEQAIIDKIAALLALKMEAVTIELVGTWLWIHGETRPHKASLKALKLKWHGKRKMWYWNNSPYRTHYSKSGFDSLRAQYGSKTFREEERRTTRKPASLPA